MSEQIKTPIVDIFIRTYASDLQWLVYTLQSINKYCTGFRNVVIVIPEKQKHLLDGFNLTREKVFTCPEYKDDYLGQQITKLYADEYSDADYLLFIDSDSPFIRPCTPADFTRDGRPLILKTKYEKVAEAIMWKPITEKVLGYNIDYEFMRRLPFCYHSSTLKSLREYIKEKQGKELSQYVQEQPQRQFSEFNTVGAYADKFQPEKYVFQDTDDGELPVLYVRQFWSWGGLTEDVIAEMKKILT